MAGGDSGAGTGSGRLWDVALSFAGAQRDYVGQVAAALKALGVRCFYDADEQVRLWGTYLAEELPRIYARESMAVVVFISDEYASRDWTRLERRAAFSRAVVEAGVYVLPARFDDSELPGLLTDVVTIDLRLYTPEQFADLVAAKLAGLAVTLPDGQRTGAGPAAAGRLLAEVRDPFALEVHRPVLPEDAPSGLPELPAYLPREHDQVLAEVVRAVTGGRSDVAVLVGGSSTGKTRACWEALRLLRGQDPPWRLWHPIDPSRPEAALRELPGIGPRTVVWLNEAQFYVGPAEPGLGERVAAGLRELLRDPARAPVLVLATLWPRYWDTLTARPAGGGADPHAQARELLTGHDITVPAAFTAAQAAQLSQAGDVRLALAARSAQDGQVIQFLAGAPELLARYRNAPPAAAAVISAAMDARRLGTGIGLPQAFLEHAAAGYLTGTEWDALDEDWLEQALAYTAVPAKGVPGPLTRIRPHPAASRATRSGPQDSGEQLAGGPGDITGGPLYRLADYLDQHGRQHRKGQFPPAAFWAAAVSHAFPADQAALGAAAHARGLYRDAAQLYKNAAAHGNPSAARYLADTPPVRWAAIHAPVGAPGAVSRLLSRLRRAGADEQTAALLRRDPAAHVSLDDPGGVAALLSMLMAAGARKQTAALLRRDPAAHVPIDNLAGVTLLLVELRWAGAPKQIAALASRAAARLPVDNPGSVTLLLSGLRAAGAQEQAAALASRAAADVSLEDLRGVARLLDRLRAAGAQEQAAALASRVAAHVSLDDPVPVASLLDSLQAAGAEQQATALASRAAAHAPLDNPVPVASLLDSLRAAGADDQAAALLARDPAVQVSLDDPGGVASLLDSLRAAGADDQAAALLARDPAVQVSLDDPGGVASLLDSLRAAGADDQAAALLARDPAVQVSLDDPGGVASLLDSLQAAGAEQQAAALASRAAAHAPLDNPVPVASLLDSLRAAGADDQAAALLARDPAVQVSLDDPYGVASLLDSLRAAGAEQQAAALVGRLPAGGMFELFFKQDGRADQFRFGREPDGTAAAPWDWDSLD